MPHGTTVGVFSYIFKVISKFPKIGKIFLSTPVLDVSALFEISKIFKIPEFGKSFPETKGMVAAGYPEDALERRGGRRSRFPADR